MPVHPALNDDEVPVVPLDLLVARMRSRLADAEIDCRCREEIESRLDGLVDENAQEALLSSLVRARAMRETIRNLLGFLGELDELGPRETDLTAFAEAAGLFNDIRQAAESGDAAMRAAVAAHPRATRAGKADNR